MKYPVLFLALACLAGGRLPAEELKLEVWPGEVALTGLESFQQLVITAHLPGGQSRDVSLDASYQSSNPAVAMVTPGGRIQAVGSGTVEVTVEARGARAVGRVAVMDPKVLKPINFENEILPILTKHTCNSGGCHGKAEGQNGFKLSLLGFDAPFDYEAIVNESRARRIFPAFPEHSLFLRKPAGQVPHGGGLRIRVESDDYRKLLRWIRAGTPIGDTTDPKVVRIEVYPRGSILDRGGRQQLAVSAHYSDGRREDVTRLTQFESNDKELAEVNEEGVVTASDLTGETSVMVRYQGQVDVYRATVPLKDPIEKWPDFPFRTLVDRHIDQKLRLLRMPPSDLAGDSEFLRRAWLDICGSVPAPEEAARFLSAPATPEERQKRREELIDRLLERPEYASFFALKWGDILRNRRQGQGGRMRGTFAFHGWIRDSFLENKPFDKFTREILTASGEMRINPAVAWYREVVAPTVRADDVAQVFLGTRIQCAQCHHHPFEKWSQADYYGMVAFFSRLGQKTPTGLAQEPVVYTRRDGETRHPRTGEVVAPRPLDGPVMPAAPGEDPRLGLARWMTSPGNAFFARAAANRMWAHFFGRGIVEPLDDMRATNPPSHPELLEELARDFEASGYDLKHLIRAICRSHTYQLSSIPNSYNQKDRNGFSRYPTKRLQAEVLHDAIHFLTRAPMTFGGLPPQTRAIDLPDESFNSTFLELFGKPKRVSSCECERVSEASLGQSLHLLNSSEVMDTISVKGGRVEALGGDARPDLEKVRELYLIAFARPPDKEESAIALGYLNTPGREKPKAYEDLVWALINTKEFQFNH
jgi:hypothetical protein